MIFCKVPAWRSFCQLILWAEAGGCFQGFHHIEYNRAAAIMNHQGKEPSGKTGEVQGRKFAAPGKAVFVYAAAGALEEMTGNFVQDQLSAGTFFKVLLPESNDGLAFHCGYPVRFFRANLYHERLAAVATAGTVDSRADLFIKPVHQLIGCIGITVAQKIPERFIFRLLFAGKLTDTREIGYQGG
jgi:hypothetical protein